MATAEDKVAQASALLTEWAHKQHHDRCWYYPDVFDQLCDLLGVQRPERPALPPRCEFEQGCLRYQNEQYGEKVDEQASSPEPNQWITEARNLLDCDFKAQGVRADIRNCLIELSDYAEKLEGEVNELREAMKQSAQAKESTSQQADECGEEESIDAECNGCGGEVVCSADGRGWCSNCNGKEVQAVIPKFIEMGRLCLKLGRVNRATFHEDGVTPESDTDHTVMLGVLACSFAEVLAPHLDLGLVSQFSQVHDFVEVHAGDTMSLGIDKQGLDDQAKREAAALISIGFEFSASLPWLPSMITAYESQATPEARFVKVLDKVMPCIAHLLNGGVTVKKLGFTAAQLRKTHADQRCRIAFSYGADQDAAMALLRAIHELLDRASIT